MLKVDIYLLILILFNYGIYLNVSVLLCPTNCECLTVSIWKCTITQQNPTIDCKSLHSDIKTISLSVHLEIHLKQPINQNHIFQNTQFCSVSFISINSFFILPNNLINNLYNLQLLKLQHLQKGLINTKYKSSLENILFQLDHLKTFKLRNFDVNNWKSDILYTCKKIQTMELIALRIKFLEFNSFQNCRELTSLTISYNNISQIFPDYFNGLVKLESLTLSYNSIRSIMVNGFGWKDVHELKMLDLSYNNINRIQSKSFKNIKKLSKLYLSKNPITLIEKDAFLDLPNLKHLYLNDIKLIHFDLEVLKPMSNSLIEIGLDFGKVQCLEHKGGIYIYKIDVRNSLAKLEDCNNMKNKDKDFAGVATTKSISQNEIFAAHFKSVIVALVVGMFLIFIFLGLMIYCCVIKRLQKTHKLLSQEASVCECSHTLSTRSTHSKLRTNMLLLNDVGTSPDQLFINYYPTATIHKSINGTLPFQKSRSVPTITVVDDLSSQYFT